MPVVISGLKELRASLRAAADASPKVVTAALRAGADVVTARARVLVPKGNPHKGSGPTMAASLKAFSNTRGAGVKTSHPGAPVQNFAGPQPYYRQTKNGRGPVTLVHVGPKGANNDRFLYKAVEDTAEALVDSTFDELTEIIKAAGWFEG